MKYCFYYTAVEVVLSKRPITMAKVTLEVETYEAPSVVSPQCVVQVSGIPKSVSRDFLELYFENNKKSGGDTLVDLKYDDEGGEAFLTYETDEGMNNHVKHSSLTLSTLGKIFSR